LNEYFIVFRVAEQYLILAEASARLNKINDALNAVNVIRARAGLVNLASTLDQSQSLSAIERERRSELFIEFGHRWFDLKRTDRLNAVMAAFKPGIWKSTADLWPIPLDQLKANKGLTQNPGY